MVPMLCVETPDGTLRVPAAQSTAQRIPTQSVGTITRSL